MDSRPAGPTAWLWLVVVAMAGTAATFGAIGLTDYISQLPAGSTFAGAGPADITYYTAQLFVLSSAPLDEPGDFGPLLEIARFLAPLTTVLALAETIRILLRDRVRAWMAAHWAGHVIVTGDTPAAVAIARRLAGQRRVVLIGSLGAEDLARRHRVHVVTGDPADEATMRAGGARRAATVYACADDGTSNAAVALVTKQVSRRPVAVYAQVRDGELVTALRARRLGAEGDAGFRLDFFAINEVAARVLLDEHPPGSAGATPAPVVIAGFGPFARAVLLELVRRRDETGGRLAVTVVTEDSDSVGEFRTTYALVARGCDMVDEPSVPNLTGDRRLYVCVTDTDEALRIGLGQVRAGEGRVVMCLGQRSALGDALAPSGVFDDARGRLAVFGILDAACDPGRLERDLIDQLARALHERYVQTCRENGDTTATNPYLRPFAELPAAIQESNYAQAEHIGVKLAEIDAVLVPAVPDATRFSYRDGEIERLAKMEHERWVAEKRGQGIQYGPVRLEGRFHPDLVRWEDLPQGSRDKDIAFVTHLPELLARNSFEILRL